RQAHFGVLHRIPRYVSKIAILAWRAGHSPGAPNFPVPLESHGLAPTVCAGCGLAETQKNPRRPDHRGPHLAGEEHLVSGVAGRYATALFDLARDANTIDAVKADLDRFDALVGESPDLTRLVRSPVFSADEQLNALSVVLDRAGIGGL